VSTVTLEMIWDYTRLIGIPRVAAIEHPFGRPFGDVDDAHTQRAVLIAALGVFESAREPGHVEHLPFEWPEPPGDTRWHPPEPAPIIQLIKQRQRKKG